MFQNSIIFEKFKSGLCQYYSTEATLNVQPLAQLIMVFF